MLDCNASPGSFQFAAFANDAGVSAVMVRGDKTDNFKRIAVIRRSLTALVISSMLAPFPAFAQGSGTEAEQEACTPDVFKLCQDFIPNEGPIVACLRAKRVELSSACSLVMFPAPAGGPVVHHAHKRRRHHTQN